MHSLAKDHRLWLSGYHNSALYFCAPGDCSCEVYHVLAPVLYDIGLLTSYKSYKPVILKIIGGLFAAINCPNILVAGIDSEASARSVIQTLDIFGSKYSLTFIDCCKTPLRRIDSCLEDHEKKYIQTKVIDIFTPAAESILGSFDLVFADSFLRQFPKPKKIKALHILAGMIKNENSRIIIREYFGDQDILLPLFWNKVERIIQQGDIDVLAAQEDVDKFLLLLEKLNNYYKETGKTYMNPGELKLDMATSHLRVINEFMNEGMPDRVIIAACLT